VTSIASRPTATPAGPSLDAATASLNAWVEVDLDALDANVWALQRAAGPGVELIAVVKANAYGAGVRGLAPALEAAGVARFAVAWVAEGVELRRLGANVPVLVLGHSFPADAAAAIEHNLTLAVDTLSLGEALSAEAVRRGRVAKVHVHVDSGLHREGLAPAEAIELATALRQLPGIEVEGVSTHMANADEADDSFSDAQHAVYRDVLAALDWVPYRHTANSATLLRRPELRYHGVRAGLALHGIAPAHTPPLGLRPILSVHARLARVFDIAPGEGVSYGLTWRAGRPSRIGLVPVGYADGWRRSLGNAGAVLVGGRRCPVIGRVCMDQFLVDITDIPGIAMGTEAVLLGPQGSAAITADEVAAAAGTIPWDIIASLQARLPRIYHRGGVVVSQTSLP
jgi:alanine racemase